MVGEATGQDVWRGKKRRLFFTLHCPSAVRTASPATLFIPIHFTPPATTTQPFTSPFQPHIISFLKLPRWLSSPLLAFYADFYLCYWNVSPSAAAASQQKLRPFTHSLSCSVCLTFCLCPGPSEFMRSRWLWVRFPAFMLFWYIFLLWTYSIYLFPFIFLWLALPQVLLDF